MKKTVLSNKIFVKKTQHCHYLAISLYKVVVTYIKQIVTGSDNTMSAL